MLDLQVNSLDLLPLGWVYKGYWACLEMLVIVVVGSMLGYILRD